MICTIVGAMVINCVVANRPTPAEAARILLPRQYIHVLATGWGPTSVVVASSPGNGPFGPLRLVAPARRLDGTLLSDPPWRMTTYLGRPYPAVRSKRDTP